MSLLPGYFGMGKKEKALENTDSKLKKKKISAGKGPVSCCSSTCEANCSSQTPLDFQGQEQNLPDKRYSGIQSFLLEFHSEKNVGFPDGFILPAKWDDANGIWGCTCPLLVQGWAIPCGNKRDWNEMIFQVPSKPNYSDSMNQFHLVPPESSSLDFTVSPWRGVTWVSKTMIIFTVLSPF